MGFVILIAAIGGIGWLLSSPAATAQAFASTKSVLARLEKAAGRAFKKPEQKQPPDALQPPKAGTTANPSVNITGAQSKLLTREAARMILARTVTSSGVLLIYGRGSTTLEALGILDPLRSAGILQAVANQNEFEIAPAFKKFVTEATIQGIRVATLEVATRTLKDITGIRSISATEAEVTFSWVWQPTDAGLPLDGVVIKVLFVDEMTIKFQGPVYSEAAKCTLWDDGWRCTVPFEDPTNIMEAMGQVP